MKVYVASSWRNEVYPLVVNALRLAGHEVYYFRRQSVSWEGFDRNVTDGVTSEELLEVLDHPVVQERFRSDMTALKGCERLYACCPAVARLIWNWATAPAS